MRRFRFLLCCCLLLAAAGGPTWADNGHWALLDRVILADSRRSNGSDTGISGAQDGALDFNLVRTVADPSWPARTWEEMHNLSFRWTAPPEYVQVGKENEIALDLTARWDGDAFNPQTEGLYAGGTESYEYALDVQIAPELRAGEYALNYTTIQYFLTHSDSITEFEDDFEDYADQIDEELDDEDVFGDYDGDSRWRADGDIGSRNRLAYAGKSWNQSLKLGEEAFMIVSVQIDIRQRTVVGGQAHRICEYYLYKCYPNGGDITKRIKGDPDRGEQDLGELPPWIIPAAAGLGLTAILGALVRSARNSKKRKGKTPAGNGPQPADTAPKKPSTFRMLLYKEFGDTLMVADKPQIVGARIEEITPEGKRIECKEYTSQIEITEGRNIRILATGMSPHYRTARICVDKYPKEDPAEGFIVFSFRGPGGTLQMQTVFKIQEGRVDFFQPNLTLPSGHDRQERLPFLVSGVNEDAEVEVSIDKCYRVSAEKGEKPGLWYAIIDEVDKTRGTAGEYISCTLKVEAKDSDEHEVSGTFPVLRFNMGLAFKTDHFVPCFLVRYEPGVHREELKVYINDKSYAPALTPATLSFIYWDEEKHRLTRMVPDPRQVVFRAEPLGAEADAAATDYLSKGTRGMSDQEVVNKVKLQYFIKEILPDNSTSCYLYACAVLDAPARRKVKIHVEFPWDGKLYTADQEVWLTSQPLREEGADTGEDDDTITSNLMHIRSYILDHNLLTNIGPVFRLAEMLLDGYDRRFGYDPGLVYLVRSTFLNFVSGRIAGANADAEPVVEMGLAADLMLALAQTSAQAEQWLEDHGGFWTRLSLGILTLGWSETALTAIRVPREMIDAVNNPKIQGGPWEAFCAGVKIVGIEFLTEAFIQTTLAGYGEMIAHYHPELAANAANFAAKAIGDVRQSLGIFGKDLRVIAHDLKSFATEKFGRQTLAQFGKTKNALDSSRRSVEDMIREWRKNAKWSAEEIAEDLACREANLKGLRKVKELERNYIEMSRYKTPEAEEAFRRLAYEIQTDKIAQKQLALYNGEWATNVRSGFYKTLKKDYDIIDIKTKQYVVDKMREAGRMIDEDDVIIYGATNSNREALENGISFTRDRDVSVLVKEKPTKSNPNPIPEDISQEIAEDCYGKAYKETTGLTLEQGDQAVVQMTSPERIGNGPEDLARAFQPEHFSEKFVDLDKVTQAFEHKPKAWLDQAAQLEESGLVEAAVAKQEEAMRQAADKLFFKSTVPRATYNGTVDRITQNEMKTFQLIGHCEVSTQGPFSLSVTDLKKMLKENYSLELEDIPGKLKEIELRVES